MKNTVTSMVGKNQTLATAIGVLKMLTHKMLPGKNGPGW